MKVKICIIFTYQKKKIIAAEKFKILEETDRRFVAGAGTAKGGMGLTRRIHGEKNTLFWFLGVRSK